MEIKPHLGRKPLDYLDLKSYLMMLIEGFRKDLNNSLKEIQETIGQQVKALKEETQKSLKEIKEVMG